MTAQRKLISFRKATKKIAMRIIGGKDNSRSTQLIGTLGKPRQRRQQGRGKTKYLMGRTMAKHVRLKLCIFLSHSLHNNNVKSPKFASSVNGERDGKLL